MRTSSIQIGWSDGREIRSHIKRHRDLTYWINQCNCNYFIHHSFLSDRYSQVATRRQLCHVHKDKACKSTKHQNEGKKEFEALLNAEGRDKRTLYYHWRTVGYINDEAWHTDYPHRLACLPLLSSCPNSFVPSSWIQMHHIHTEERRILTGECVDLITLLFL